MGRWRCLYTGSTTQKVADTPYHPMTGRLFAGIPARPVAVSRVAKSRGRATG